MTDSFREDLLGHALGALDDAERAAFDERLRNDASLRDLAAQWRQRLESLDAAKAEFDFAPPTGLAERTCRLVAEYEDHRPTPASVAATSGRHAMTPEHSPPSWIGRIRWADVATAACFFVAAALLTIPALQHSRFNARKTACVDNLRAIGGGLQQYSDYHGGFFPRIPVQGKLAQSGIQPGIYASTLADGQLVTDSSRFVCPGSALAEQKTFRLIPLEELRKASPRQLAQYRRWLGGSFGYTLGHTRDGVYYPTKNLGRPYFALVADAPCCMLPGYQSDNHGGCGQNVLFEDGHVRFLTTPRPCDGGDDIFVNDDGYMAAGLHADDAVIGSGVTPSVIWVGRPR